MIPKFRAFYEGKMYGVKAVIWTSRGLYVTLDEGNKAGRRVRGAKLMQSTGLFDVNGKEIFEGDVIRVNYTDDDSPWTDAIIWSPKDCAWYLKSNKELLGFAMDEPDIIVEVIGNIYENPELVEEE
ncbi:YopX family protein [Streptococcus suis]|uniref:YopX family protein n=1 Tax=Streptococcus suis TaxID=1307 RepID=UPI0003FD35EC|nr:YopX family protein [Streptococcus suis]